jgi:hypothetical protein
MEFDSSAVQVVERYVPSPANTVDILAVRYSIPSLVRGFWDEKFSTRKSRTTEGNDKSPLTYQ